MFANNPLKHSSPIMVLEKKITAKSKPIHSRDDVTRPIGTLTHDLSIPDNTSENLASIAKKGWSSTITMKKHRRVVTLPSVVLRHDGTLVKMDLPLPVRKSGLALFESTKQKNKFIEMLNQPDFETIDVGVIGDVVYIAATGNPYAHDFFATAGIYSVLCFSIDVEEIQFPQSYFLCPRLLKDTGNFNDRTFEIPDFYDYGPIPEFSMDMTFSDEDDDVLDESGTLYMKLFLHHCNTGESMYEVERMYRHSSTFVSWAHEQLKNA